MFLESVVLCFWEKREEVVILCFWNFQLKNDEYVVEGDEYDSDVMNFLCF